MNQDNLIFNKRLTLLIQSETDEEASYKDPIILDIDKDSRNDLVIIKESNEGYSCMYIYLQKTNAFSLVLKTNSSENSVVENKSLIKQSFSFENIDEDKEYELIFNYLEVKRGEKPYKNVIYDLQDGKFVMIYKEKWF